MDTPVTVIAASAANEVQARSGSRSRPSSGMASSSSSSYGRRTGRPLNYAAGVSAGEASSRKAALESKTGQYLLYLKDSLQGMEKNLSKVRLVVQKRVGLYQGAQNAYKSPDAKQESAFSTHFLDESDLLAGLEDLKRAHEDVLALASSAPALGLSRRGGF